MPAVTYLEAIRLAMLEEMERDPRVFVIGEDVGTYGGAFRVTAGFLERFGEARVIDTPVSETAIVGASIGAALMGLRPIAEMQFIDFISCTFDMIVNYAAKSRYRWGAGVPLVVRGPAGGGVHGGPFHSQNPEAYFMNVPGLKIVAPGTAADAKGLMTAAIRDPDPVIFLEHKFLYRRIKEVLPAMAALEPLGRARVAREGSDVTLVGYGATTWTCLEAAEVLESEGVAAEVVDLRTLVPYDEAAVLASVQKTSRAVVVHEDLLTAGFGAEVAARLADAAFPWLDAPVKRVAYPDRPSPYAKVLEGQLLPDREKVLAAAREVLRY
jgi:2-oxoisovalerate dehydrogenase E1 component beta subunit